MDTLAAALMFFSDACTLCLPRETLVLRVDSPTQVSSSKIDTNPHDNAADRTALNDL